MRSKEGRSSLVFMRARVCGSSLIRDRARSVCALPRCSGHRVLVHREPTPRRSGSTYFHTEKSDGYFDAKGHQPYKGGFRSPIPFAGISIGLQHAQDASDPARGDAPQRRRLRRIVGYPGLRRLLWQHRMDWRRRSERQPRNDPPREEASPPATRTCRASRRISPGTGTSKRGSSSATWGRPDARPARTCISAPRRTGSSSSALAPARRRQSPPQTRAPLFRRATRRARQDDRRDSASCCSRRSNGA